MDLEQAIFAEQDDSLPAELASMSTDAVKNRSKLLDNEIRVLKEEANRLSLELSGMKEKVKENKEKIKLNNQLPYLVANIVEVLEVRSTTCHPRGQCLLIFLWFCQSWYLRSTDASGAQHSSLLILCTELLSGRHNTLTVVLQSSAA